MGLKSKKERLKELEAGLKLYKEEIEAFKKTSEQMQAYLKRLQKEKEK